MPKAKDESATKPVENVDADQVAVADTLVDEDFPCAQDFADSDDDKPLVAPVLVSVSLP